MKLFRRIISMMLAVLVAAQLGVMAFAVTENKAHYIEEIVGVYDGSYTATQGITGLTLSIYKTRDLLGDDRLLQKYADVANSCGVSSSEGTEKLFTADDIRQIVSEHTDDYIALFNYFPMVDEAGVGPNPDVEEGLYTMTVTYDETTGKYEFIGSQWIQHDTYVFVDLKQVVLNDDKLEGEVYGQYASWFWTEYGDIGDVSVSSGKGQSGYRIDFENESASLSVGEKQTIRAVVKNNEGLPATDRANIKWFSNDESIAVITGESWGERSFDWAVGTISGVSEGMTEVYAALDNQRVATCTVVVAENGTIAPLEIETSYELISQITSSTEGKITTYRFAPNYEVTATIKNPDTDPVDHVVVKLNLPDGASLYDNGELTARIDRLNSNESRTLSWSITVAGDYHESTSVQYSICAESDQTAQIQEHKTIFVDPFVGKDNRIDYDTDVWDFTNSGTYFDNGYFASSRYYESLKNAVSHIEWERIDSYLKASWGGSCYGMSAIASLTKLDRLDPADYDTGASVLKDLPAPKDSDEVYSLITYYHMTQKLDACAAAEDQYLRLEEPERLIALVNAVEKVKIGGTPVLLSIWFMSRDYDIHELDKGDYFSGHAIVAYDVEYGEYKVKSLVDKTKSTYDKRVVIYDPNNNTNPIYLYISSDFTKWIVDGYCQNQTKEDGLYWFAGEGSFTFVEDADILDAINVRDSIENYYDRLIADANTRLKITYENEDGAAVELDAHGMNISDSGGKVLAYPDSVGSDGTVNGFRYVFPEGTEALTVVPEAGEDALDLSYCSDGVMYTARTENAEAVTFSQSDSVEMECSGAYTLTAVYNEGSYSDPWYYYSVSGAADGTIGIARDSEGYTIISGDDLRGLTLTVKSDAGETVRQIDTRENSVMIRTEEGAIVLYGDKNNDGTFEDNLDKAAEFTALLQKYLLLILIGAGAIVAAAAIVVITVAVKKKRS